MRYSFRYTQIPPPPSPPFPDGQLVFRPYLVAEVVAIATGLSLRCLVWPDSGADHCVFPLTFTKTLVLDPLAMPMHTTGGVGNSANVTYYGDVQIKISGGNSPTISFNAFAGFTAGTDAQGTGLLGQSGFFENFRVMFDCASRVFSPRSGVPTEVAVRPTSAGRATPRSRS